MPNKGAFFQDISESLLLKLALDKVDTNMKRFIKDRQNTTVARCILLFVFAAVLTPLLSCNSKNDDVTAANCDSSNGIEINPVAIPACDGLSPGSEDCHLRIMWNSSECCDEQPCDRMVVFWAGGNQTCDDVLTNGDGEFDAFLRHYADRGYIAACAQPYTSEEAGGAYPYYMEWDRMHFLMQRLRSETADIWDGTHLLISGSSHGGTSPMVMIASHRALQDYPEVWTGSTHTAVIMFDGISNPRKLEEWAGNQAFGSSCGFFHSRWVGRYRDGSPLTHSCSNDACYCSDPNHAGDWALDTLTPGATDPDSPYQCSDYVQNSKNTLYRFVSCSGTPGASACSTLNGDIVPDEQQSDLFNALRFCEGITASYARYDCPHLFCGGFDTQTNCGGADAIDWLNDNGW
jgi:hypothetical protein